MAIKCHSSFVHYNMFHNNHCHGGGNNYGSIFNITNNCGGGTSFWGGLGAGLGFGLGNMFGGMFGNMFGGLGNFGMGGFGLGNFGFGGWGNGMSGLWGNGWGGGNAGGANNDYSKYSSNKSTCNCKCGDGKDGNSKKDIDNAKFASITDKIAKLKAGQVSDADYNAIKKELDDALKATDGIQTEDDKKTYNNLLKTLDNLKAGKAEPKPAVGNGNINVANYTVDDIIGITQDDYDKLSDADKNALKAKIKKLPENDRVGIAKLKTLPSDLRIAAKESFYSDGYSNVSLDSLTDDEIKKLKTVIDTSKVDDFRNIKSVTDITRDESGKLKSFKMTAQSGTNVTYVKVTVYDNELIFHGKNEDQNYVLQKDPNTQYHLMQYAYHLGHGIPDVRCNK